MAQTDKCVLIVTDGREDSILQNGPSEEFTVLQYVLDSVWTVADEIFVIFGREPSLSTIETIAPFGVKVAVERDGESPFSLILAGFRASNSENCLVVSSQAPLVKPNVLYALFESLRGYDAAVPRWSDGRSEPLLSAYSSRAFQRAAAGLTDSSLESLVESLYAVKYLDIEESFRPLDPELHSFFKITSSADLKAAKGIATLRRVASHSKFQAPA